MGAERRSKERDMVTLQNASIVLFANRLAYWMNMSNLKPSQLDEMTKLSPGTTATFLQGNDLPQRATIFKYAYALRIPHGDLWLDIGGWYGEDVVYPTG